MRTNVFSIVLTYATMPTMALITTAALGAESERTTVDVAAANAPTISQAQRNVLKRIAQLTDIEWQPVLQNTMPSRTGVFSGDPVKGVPYSSARGVGRWIGYDISLETFMTAVQNPKSVLYTENLKEDPYNVPNAATYYGLTCSSFVQYAFRDDFSWSTSHVHEDPQRANMRLIQEQSADGVEVCDILNTSGGGHMEMITGIDYSGEEVASIKVTDIGYGGPRRKTFSPAQFEKYVSDRKYRIYRYNLPESIPYTPSKYVAVGNEERQQVVYNEVLALDRGNKTNYVKDTCVEYNIMDDDAALLVVTEGGMTVDTMNVTEIGAIERIYSDCGRYSAHCVMSDQLKSDMVEFIVSNIAINVPDEVEASEDITIAFAAEACEPRYVTIQTAGFGGQVIRSLTEQEINEGSVTIACDRAGSFSVVASGANEFGGVYSNREPISIVGQGQ